jgi:hypothetical protein
MHTNDVAQIAPPEDSAEHVVEFGERHLIGDRDQADDHRAHLAQNRSQNQAFEGSCLKHPSRLLDRPTPDFSALSAAGGDQSEVADYRIPRREKDDAEDLAVHARNPRDRLIFCANANVSGKVAYQRLTHAPPPP